MRNDRVEEKCNKQPLAIVIAASKKFSASRAFFSFSAKLQYLTTLRLPWMRGLQIVDETSMRVMRNVHYFLSQIAHRPRAG